MQGPTAKVLGVGLLALLMLIPLMQVRWLVQERQGMRETAIEQIAQGWGGRQVIGGLVLSVPTRETIDADEPQKTRVRLASETVLADEMQLSSAMDVQTRRYGMYGAPIFTSTVQLSGRFLPEDLAAFQRASSAEWMGDKAELRLLLRDLRGLQEVTALKINGRPARFVSSTERVGELASIVVPIDLTTLAGQAISFEVGLKLAGTESLQVLPLARATSVQISAPWKDPSFIGAALPGERKLDASGFAAHWRMLDLNRSYGQHWVNGDARVEALLGTSAFGVQLYQPVDVYQRNERAGKYGLLFIAMTFVAFFLFEVLRRLRVHPVQYLLVGAALATFYVVLLALSEQIGFGPAYAVAAAAVVTIVGGYAAAVLQAKRAGLLLGGVLALVYALLYGLIAAEQYALLMGAGVLLATVALLMYLTRRIDWYGLSGAVEPPHGEAGNMEGS